MEGGGALQEGPQALLLGLVNSSREQRTAVRSFVNSVRIARRDVMALEGRRGSGRWKPVRMSPQVRTQANHQEEWARRGAGQ